MLTVAWDLDDVLNGLMRAWLEEWWRPAHPECQLAYADIPANPPDAALGITRAAYLESLDAFRVSDAAAAMAPNPAILEWLAQHGASCRHIVLTARPLGSAAHASAWVFRHFAHYVRSFNVVPSRIAAGVEPYDRTKRDFLAWFGKADVLVDDSEENVCAARKLGMRGVLYPQPWNAGAPLAETLRLLTEMTRSG